MELDGAEASIRGPDGDHQHLQGHGGVRKDGRARATLAAGTLPAGAVRGLGIQASGEGGGDLQVLGAGDGGPGSDVDR